ncbi:hypothetical protein JQ557_09405 [Bradyrhizobium sp. U87765 SZCCT0131]|uniref:hypothetical protein n=1 Tax=unclassified Bradyrhizobium TaxID=2631580 RepID=UPI001BA4838E|nr:MULTISPECIES: hypothetical protein [unclassified Bradyrhizobium]MBR1218202.1 hypothetical protein [Bradyrhizobium sp. U87765 SZCCT0131]MBR1260852.1 hypothetical protein [Bradyrhizobium sp. U87765 SZCCT0134]MBR1303700.1 hypothetical protein [Bradyrhizobium sp. U87765 SZCCT0110]MBR1319306.1 hypothetical protein [Bradyrhizobium sp. U87765 SZCCT0109]MBR1347631.1 hypothetical protein [Bradyrhizobium sp. U87765 SZCCT0048]
MADRGSLFLQHLKQEAIIIRDDSSFFSSLLAQYRPKRNYQQELSDSLRLLLSLSRERLDYWPMLCSADIAYTAIRNIGICRLAEQGTFIFGYLDLIEHLERENSTTPTRLAALRHLRAMKHSYRRRLVSNFSLHVLCDALEGARDLLLLNDIPASPTKVFSGYSELRLLELKLVGKVDPRYLDSLSPHDPLATAWAIICDPRGYPNQPKFKNHRWIASVNDIADERFGAA